MIRFQAKALVLLTFCLLGGAGCGSVKPVTVQEREVSFAPFEEYRVGSESLREFVLARTAALVNIDALEVSGNEGESDLFVGGEQKAGGETVLASAAAIDRRGYFVTAAHCVEDREVSLFFWNGEKPAAAPARVVFAGKRPYGGSDFAVLHVPVKLRNVFRWGPVPEPGAEVISAGGYAPDSPSDDPYLQFTLDPVGGTIQQVENHARGGFRSRILSHDSPLKRGNSGGPLVDARGRLLGVNTTGAAAIPWLGGWNHEFPHAIRPDLEWLRALIEEDAERESVSG